MKILKMEPPTVSPFSSAVKLEITVQAQDKQAVVDLTKKIQSGKKPYDLGLIPSVTSGACRPTLMRGS